MMGDFIRTPSAVDILHCFEAFEHNQYSNEYQKYLSTTSNLNNTLMSMKIASMHKIGSLREPLMPKQSFSASFRRSSLAARQPECSEERRLEQ